MMTLSSPCPVTVADAHTFVTFASMRAHAAASPAAASPAAASSLAAAAAAEAAVEAPAPEAAVGVSFLSLESLGCRCGRSFDGRERQPGGREPLDPLVLRLDV